jgi:Arc/MetJ-type ribon-helix-helix transcriptional regulator
MKSIQVTLPDEIAAFVERVLAEKKWDTVDNLVAYALLQVENELRLDEHTDLDALRKAIQIGIDQADRGEVAELDMKEVWERATVCHLLPADRPGN